MGGNPDSGKPGLEDPAEFNTNVTLHSTGIIALDSNTPIVSPGSSAPPVAAARVQTSGGDLSLPALRQGGIPSARTVEGSSTPRADIPSASSFANASAEPLVTQQGLEATGLSTDPLPSGPDRSSAACGSTAVDAGEGASELNESTSGVSSVPQNAPESLRSSISSEFSGPPRQS